MSQSEWQALCFETRDAMAEYVWPFTTPISSASDFESGTALGTGNYLAINDDIYVVTNEHVARHLSHSILAHLPRPGDYYVRFEHEFRALGWPDDIAFSKLGEHGTPEESKIITPGQFDDSYNPVAKELLFWLGYPGTSLKRTEFGTEKQRVSYFGQLTTPGTPVLSQELPVWPEQIRAAYKKEYHKLIHYPRVARSHAQSEPVEVPNPAGMSGSLLWDTKRVHFAQNALPWSPSSARVCGILWATDLEPDIVVVTPVERLLSAIAELPANEDE